MIVKCTYVYMPILGENLKAARTRAGLTQKDVEARLGLRELSLRDYETERLKLPAPMALKLAELYGVGVGELLGTDPVAPPATPQAVNLGRLSPLFARGDAGLLFLDPVIRAHLEEHRDKIFDFTLFDLFTTDFSARDRRRFATELLRGLASLVGVDRKITPEELAFLRELIAHFGLSEQAKGIMKMTEARFVPDASLLQGRPAAKHFFLWMLFLLARSDQKIAPEELAYIEECAEHLKVNRSNYLMIRAYFVKEKF